MTALAPFIVSRNAPSSSRCTVSFTTPANADFSCTAREEEVFAPLRTILIKRGNQWGTKNIYICRALTTWSTWSTSIGSCSSKGNRGCIWPRRRQPYGAWSENKVGQGGKGIRRLLRSLDRRSCKSVYTDAALPRSLDTVGQNRCRAEQRPSGPLVYAVMTAWLAKIKDDAKVRQLPPPAETATPTVMQLTAGEFCRAVLPQSGHYCVQVLHTLAPPQTVWATSAIDAGQKALALDAGGSGDVYVAIAGFATPRNRKADNVALKRSLYLDLDCGTGKPYADKRAAREALKKFCADSGIPVPSIVVNSGHGLHVHWPLTRDIPPADWQSMAHNLKTACRRYGLAADEIITADVARILRVPGTHNKKDNSAPLPVTGVRLGPPYDPDSLAAVLVRAAGAAPVGATEIVGVLQPVFAGGKYKQRKQ